MVFIRPKACGFNLLLLSPPPSSPFQLLEKFHPYRSPWPRLVAIRVFFFLEKTLKGPPQKRGISKQTPTKTNEDSKLWSLSVSRNWSTDNYCWCFENPPVERGLIPVWWVSHMPSVAGFLKQQYLFSFSVQMPSCQQRIWYSASHSPKEQLQWLPLTAKLYKTLLKQWFFREKESKHSFWWLPGKSFSRSWWLNCI